MTRQYKMPGRVVAIVYEPRIKAVTVEFDDGQVYRYCPVPRAIFLALRASVCSDTHFHRHIKDRYHFKP